MKLKDIFEQLVREQGAGIMPMPPMAPPPGGGMPPITPIPPVAPMVPPPAGMPPPMPGGPMDAMPPPPPPPLSDGGVVELADVNMSVSVFTGEKKLVFSPQDHEATTEKIKKYINVFKKNFRINSINSLDKGSFELEFDPRENFGAAVEFLQKLSDHETKTGI